MLLIPDGLSEYHNRIYGSEDNDGLRYARVPGDKTLSLNPFDASKIAFPTNSLIVPRRDVPARQCTVVVRVFDQHGRAAEAQVDVSLFPAAGELSEQKVRTREELYT
jgi:hypothetical protein